jgi:hypothetical protein
MFRNWLDISPRATLLHAAPSPHDGCLFEKQALGGLGCACQLDDWPVRRHHWATLLPKRNGAAIC